MTARHRIPNNSSIDTGVVEPKEFSMKAEDERPQTFDEGVLALLREHFPWLGSNQDEPVSGADTVDELSDLYESLNDQRDTARQEKGGPKL
jgi:hypothetical protein